MSLTTSTMWMRRKQAALTKIAWMRRGRARVSEIHFDSGLRWGINEDTRWRGTKKELCL